MAPHDAAALTQGRTAPRGFAAVPLSAAAEGRAFADLSGGATFAPSAARKVIRRCLNKPISWDVAQGWGHP